MDAAGGKWSGFYGQQTYLQRRALRDCRHRKCGGTGSGCGTGEKPAAAGPVSHGILPELKAVLVRPDYWT